MIKDQELSVWKDWIDNELELPHDLSDEMVYVFEAFDEALDEITRLQEELRNAKAAIGRESDRHHRMGM